MTWIRSSHCKADQPMCVEVQRDADGWATVRDGKEPNGRFLLFDPDEWSAFIAGVKAGEFD